MAILLCRKHYNMKWNFSRSQYQYKENIIMNFKNSPKNPLITAQVVAHRCQCCPQCETKTTRYTPWYPCMHYNGLLIGITPKQVCSESQVKEQVTSQGEYLYISKKLRRLSKTLLNTLFSECGQLVLLCCCSTFHKP